MSDVSALQGRHKAPFTERLLNALVDPSRREGAVLALLAGYAVVWSLYGAIAKGSQDIHFDMGEQIAWSREVTFGTPKHPPLPAWLIRVWFGIFPLQDWAYYLLAILLATASLWVAWRISARYLAGEKRVVGLALLSLVPFYNFHALKLNSNALMTITWALATWAFLRSHETRRPIDAALAGLAAAAAMLDKYWSIFLLLGLGIAALIDPRRRDYFRSSAPWVTIAVGLAALAPHFAWLYDNGFTPFRYAAESHAASWREAIASGFGYVGGAVGYVLLPSLIAAAAARPSWSAIADTVWPREPDRRLIVVAFVMPLVVPLAAVLVAKEAAVSLWAIGSMTLFPPVLLSSQLVKVSRTAARHILALALAVPIVAVALSPVIAIVIHRQGVPNDASHYRLVAQAAEQAWRDTTDRPLRLVGSYDKLLYGALFYFSGRPSTLEIRHPEVTPWTDAQRIAREGIVLFCPAEDGECIKAIDAVAAHGPPGKRVEVELSRRYLGFSDKPVRYVIVIVPPDT
jgi:4-amino-4-deoxy-L-arabinose transferase-like glycosyltransferase